MAVRIIKESFIKRIDLEDVINKIWLYFDKYQDDKWVEIFDTETNNRSTYRRLEATRKDKLYVDLADNGDTVLVKIICPKTHDVIVARQCYSPDEIARFIESELNKYESE